MAKEAPSNLDPAEGTVEWDAANEFFSGKKEEAAPAAEPGTEQIEPEIKEFKYRGKTLKVDAEQYEVLEGLRREARGENGRLGSEIAQYRERLARLEGALTSREPAVPSRLEVKRPDPALAISDFATWDRQNDAYQDAKLEAKLTQLEQKYVGDRDEQRRNAEEIRAQEAWAARFYQTFDHLNNPRVKPVVTQVYIENKPEIDGFGNDVEGAQERLAELSDARLVELREVGKQAKTNRPPRIESSAGSGPRRKEEPPKEFTSASWASREKARLRGESLK